MKYLGFTLILSVLFLSSCGKHLVLNYTNNPENKGTIHLQPTRSISETFLTVNDQLLVENEHVKKITLQQMPDGFYGIHLACNSSTFKDKLDWTQSLQVKGGQAQTQLIEVPPLSSGYWIQSAIYTAGGWAGLIVLLALDDEE